MVLLAFPHPGVRSIGFVTREFAFATAVPDRPPCSLVFVPTTPNPTSGFLVAVPQRDLETLDDHGRGGGQARHLREAC